MMGQLDTGQDKLFYSFNIDSHVPQTHLLRGIDQALDLGDLRQHLAPFYSPIGRPSIDPELMIRMLIAGYCFGIRSERGLCEEVHLNLAYRWFCGLGLEDVVHSCTLARHNRTNVSDEKSIGGDVDRYPFCGRHELAFKSYPRPVGGSPVTTTTSAGGG
jgi:transposase